MSAKSGGGGLPAASPLNCRKTFAMRALPDRLVALLFTLALALAVPTAPVAAQPAPAAEAAAPAADQPAPALTGLDGALAHFLDDDFDETDTGIIGGRGERRSARRRHHRGAAGRPAARSAPSRRRSSIKDASGTLIDAATGDAGGGTRPPTSTTVRLNNRLRRALDAALGGLTLAWRPIPAKRFEAAQAVFKSRDASALPALDAALGKETDPRDQAGADRGARRRHPVLRRRLRSRQARRRRVIRARGDQDALGLLAGLPAGTPAAVQRAARDAVDVDRRAGSRSGPRCRTPGTAFRSARCCCSPRSGSPSPSA